MVQMDTGFNASDAPDRKSFEPIPAGEYVALITESDFKPNGNATGTVIKLTWEIVEGPHQGRKIFETINYSHTSEKCQNIGRGQCKELTLALGKLKFDDTSELHDIPCKVKVGIKPAHGQYEASNKITKYTSLTAPATAPATATHTTARPAASAAPPWKR